MKPDPRLVEIYEEIHAAGETMCGRPSGQLRAEELKTEIISWLREHIAAIDDRIYDKPSRAAD